jgi:hypothetical protein
MHSFTSLTEKNGDFMKVPHTEPLNTTQSSKKPAGFEVNGVTWIAISPSTTRASTAVPNRTQFFPAAGFSERLAGKYRFGQT